MHPDPRTEIWRLLLHGQRSMMLRLTAELKRDHDLTPAQFEAMLALHLAPDGCLSASHLGRDLVYSSGSTTNLVKRLEERGLVTRTVDPGDARVVKVGLSDAGSRLIADARAQHLADLTRAFHPLVHDDEVESLLAFARRLDQSARAQDREKNQGTDPNNL